MKTKFYCVSECVCVCVFVTVNERVCVCACMHAGVWVMLNLLSLNIPSDQPQYHLSPHKELPLPYSKHPCWLSLILSLSWILFLGSVPDATWASSWGTLTTGPTNLRNCPCTSWPSSARRASARSSRYRQAYSLHRACVVVRASLWSKEQGLHHVYCSWQAWAVSYSWIYTVKWCSAGEFVSCVFCSGKP